MIILAIDTSTKYISLAIAEKDKVVSVFNRDREQRHCARLIPEIDKFLKRAKLRLRDIGFIAFSIGPGAFTGLRIGAATVKALALAAKIKIVGVPTLDALAQGLAPESSLIVPIVDARRGNVYASVYSFKGGQLKRYMKYSVLPAAELIKKVKADAVFLGDGLIHYRKTIEDNFKFKAEFADEREWYPKAAIVAGMGYESIRNKKFEDPDKFVPMYVYPKDVQVRSGKNF